MTHSVRHFDTIFGSNPTDYIGGTSVEGFMMKAEDQLKLEIIHKVTTRAMTRAQGMALLGISESTIKRWIQGYREKGIGFLRHGNCLRKPANKHPDQLKTDVQRLVKEKYFDFNMLHGLEKIKEEVGGSVSRETFRRWCHEIKMVKKVHKRRGKPRRYRQRMSQPGLLVQMDGSHHRWFADRETCLIAAIDDATSKVLWAKFFEGETTLACLDVLKHIVKEDGLFKVLYVDKAGVFGGTKRNNFSQVERALGELGTDVIYAHSPEAKGRIERLFNTLQDRLIPEMRLNKIRTMEQANEYLHSVHLPQHNARFSVLATNPKSAFVPYYNQAKLDDIFCIIEHRIVGRDHTISWQGKKYMIADELKYSINKQRVEMRYDAPKGCWRAFFADRELTLVDVKQMPQKGAAAV